MLLTDELERRLRDDVRHSPKAHLVLGAELPSLGTEPYVREDGSILIYRAGLSERLHRYLWRVMVDPQLGQRRLRPACELWGCQNPRHFVLSEHGARQRPDGEPVERRHTRPDAAARNARKTHCPRHHPYTPENTYLWHDPQGREHRACRVCKAIHRRAMSDPNARLDTVDR